MHKVIRIILISSFLVSTGAFLFFQYKARPSQIHAYIGDEFRIPEQCKHIALLGCTPHPTNYVKRHANNPELLDSIKLGDFLDLDYLGDSFNRTFMLCKENDIDHLVIAYLPIYYLGMHQLLGDGFVKSCRLFLDRIIKEIVPFIEKEAQKVGYRGQITVIVLPDYQLARVPMDLAGIEDRIRYLIKQFPRLKNISGSGLQTITIINNKESQEDDVIINYLKYEYLYEKPIMYKKLTTGKERFHSDKKI